MYAKLFRKKVIFDFDDSLWVPVRSYNNEWSEYFKCYWKVASVCKWAYKVSAGNRYLYDYAGKFNKNVVLNPTCVDTENKHNVVKDQHTDKIKIGWTGSFTTLPFLDSI